MFMFIPVLKFTCHSKLAQIHHHNEGQIYSFCVVNMFLDTLQMDNLKKNCNTAIIFLM